MQVDTCPYHSVDSRDCIIRGAISWYPVDEQGPTQPVGLWWRQDYTSKHKSFVPGPTYVPPPWPVAQILEIGAGLWTSAQLRAKIGKPFCPEGGRFMLDVQSPVMIFPSL